MLVVAWFDFRTRKISNIWPATNLLLALLLPFIIPEIYQHHWELWLVPLAFIGVGFILFRLNIMGAGDSKYLFALFLLLPQKLHENFLLKLLAVTVFVGAILLGFRIMTKWSEIKLWFYTRSGSLREIFGEKFTYGPVILVAWIWFIGENLWLK